MGHLQKCDLDAYCKCDSVCVDPQLIGYLGSVPSEVVLGMYKWCRVVGEQKYNSVLSKELLKRFGLQFVELEVALNAR